jgi:hypothetical protein
MGYRSRMSQGLILIDTLSFACWEEKEKKREVAGDFFPRARARHALLGVQGRSFVAVSCN